MGLEFNPNIRTNGLQGKQIFKLEDAATLERTDAPMFNFQKQEKDLIPELKPRYIDRIESKAENDMAIITGSMPNSVAEQKKAKEFTLTVNDMLGFDYTKYVTPETALHAAMNPFLA